MNAAKVCSRCQANAATTFADVKQSKHAIYCRCWKRTGEGEVDNSETTYQHTHTHLSTVNEIVKKCKGVAGLKRGEKPNLKSAEIYLQTSRTMLATKQLIEIFRDFNGIKDTKREKFSVKKYKSPFGIEVRQTICIDFAMYWR